MLSILYYLLSIKLPPTILVEVKIFSFSLFCKTHQAEKGFKIMSSQRGRFYLRSC